MESEVAIIGAGLAGICCAYSLARRGVTTKIIDKNPAIALGASGNSDGLLAPYFDNAFSARAKFYQSGFKLTLQLLNQLETQGFETSFRRHGILQLPSVSRVRSLLTKESFNSDPGLEAYKVDPRQASQLSAVDIEHPGLYFPQAGSLIPRKLCQNLLAAAGSKVELQLGEQVLALEQEKAGWRLKCKSGRLVKARAVILANAYAAAELLCAEGLVLNRIRGQVMQVPCSKYSANLKVAVSYDGYIIPARAGQHIVGASYANRSFGPQNSSAETTHILKRIHSWLPGLAQSLPGKSSGRASFRTNSIDRLPYIGELPRWPAVFVSLAHGSRGLVTCYIAAEFLAQKLAPCKDAAKFDQWEIVDPARSVNSKISHAAA